MNRLACVLLATLTYAACAHSTLYSCDVFNEKQKIATLTGSLNNSGPSARVASAQSTDPNTALAFLLCQQAGLNPVNVMMAVPSIRASSGVTKSQLLPNPACTLKCTSR